VDFHSRKCESVRRIAIIGGSEQRTEESSGFARAIDYATPGDHRSSPARGLWSSSLQVFVFNPPQPGQLLLGAKRQVGVGEAVLFRVPAGELVDEVVYIPFHDYGTEILREKVLAGGVVFSKGLP
jgi:hypothetical protein